MRQERHLHNREAEFFIDFVPDVIPLLQPSPSPRFYLFLLLFLCL
jgi:hypothetical protein